MTSLSLIMFKIYKGIELNEDDLLVLTTCSVEAIQWIASQITVVEHKNYRSIKLSADGSQTAHEKKSKRKKSP